jgi:hypothetical protein
MAWKDFLFGVAAALSAELLLAATGVAIALLRTERVSKKLLKAAKKLPDKKRDDCGQ